MDHAARSQASRCPPTCVFIQACSGHDAAGDGPTCVNLGLHLVAALQRAMLRHHQALVVLQGGAGAIRLAGEALMLAVALHARQGEPQRQLLSRSPGWIHPPNRQ